MPAKTFLESRKKNERLFDILQKNRNLTIGGFQIRIAVFHQVRLTSKATNAWHTHACYELSTVRAGSMHYHYKDERITCGPGQSFFMPPHIRHQWRVGPKGAHIDGFLMDVSPLDASATFSLAALPAAAKKQGYRLAQSSDLLALYRKIDLEIQYPKPWADERIPMLIKDVLIHVFRENFPQYYEETHGRNKLPAKKNRDLHLFLMAKDFIDQRKNEVIGVQDVAGKLGISPGYVNMIFRRNIDIPCGRYIAEQRLWEAFNLLKSSPHLKIKEVAEQCGFRDALYFTRLFTRKFLTSPKKLRMSVYM